MSKSLSNPSNFKKFKYIQEENSTLSTYKETEAGSSDIFKTNIFKKDDIPDAGKNSVENTCFNKIDIQTIRRKYESAQSSLTNSKLPSSNSGTNSGINSRTNSSKNSISSGNEKQHPLTVASSSFNNLQNRSITGSTTMFLSAHDFPTSSTKKILLDKSHSQMMSSALSLQNSDFIPKINLSRTSDEDSCTENQPPKHHASSNKNENLQPQSPQARISKLEQQLQETISKNVAWQKYNQEREDFVRGIFQKMEILQKENESLKNNNKTLFFQIDHLKSSTGAIAVEQRTQLDKTIIRLTEDLARLRKQETELSQENEELTDAVNSIHQENHEMKSELRTVQCELELEKSTKMLRNDNNQALEQKVRILADNNKLLAKQVDNFAKMAMSESKSQYFDAVANTPQVIKTTPPSKKTPNSQKSTKKVSDKFATSVLNSTVGPPDISLSHTKFIPLTLKYSTHNDSMNSSKMSKSSNTSKISLTPKSSSPSKKSSRRKTHIGSSTSTPRNRVSDSWFTSPETTVSSKSEEHGCQFCGKIFTDFRKVIKHIDTCEGV